MQTKRSRSSRAGSVGTTVSLLLLGSLLVAAAAMFAYQRLTPVIEQDLRNEVANALNGTGVTSISVDGQDIFLAGEVNSDAARNEAEKAAASVYGVSRVFNNLTVNSNGNSNGSTASANNIAATTNADTPKATDTLAVVTAIDDNAKQAATNPVQNQATALIINNVKPGAGAPSTLTIVVNDGVVNTQGIVSDDDTIKRINNALAGKFGQSNIKDDMSSFKDSEAPVWIDGILAMIDQLDGISNPILKVTGSDLVLAGTVTAEDIRRVKVSTAERLLGSKLNIIDTLTVKAEEPAEPSENKAAIAVNTDRPLKRQPPSIEIMSNKGSLTLSGSLADEDQANALRGGLSSLFGQNGFTDELIIDNSLASANWINEAISVTSQLSDVSDFGLSIRSGQMLLSGKVPDRDRGRDLSVAATEIAGSKLDILDNFAVNNTNVMSNSQEDLLAQSLMQELNALPTRNIVFNKNSTTLTPSAREVLDDVAAAILGYKDLVVEIAGHTDSSGDAVRNLKLSKERATAVRDYLVEKNVPPSRLSPIGYGETAPISDNELSEGRAANRRIEFNL